MKCQFPYGIFKFLKDFLHHLEYYDMYSGPVYMTPAGRYNPSVEIPLLFAVQWCVYMITASNSAHLDPGICWRDLGRPSCKFSHMNTQTRQAEQMSVVQNFLIN